MTVIRPLGDEGAALARLLEIEEHCDRAVQILKAQIEAIENGADFTKTDVNRTVQDAHRAMQSYIEARNKVADERKKENAFDKEFGIDLDDARDKIGRLLDRIRESRNAEGISGQS